MRAALLLVFFAALSATVSGDSKRLEDLEALASSNSLIPLNSEGYKKFINTNPRPYIAIIFAAPIKSPQYKSLDEVLENLKEVAYSYEYYHRSRRSRNPGEQRQLAFFSYDTTDDGDALLAQHGLQSMLGLFILPVTKDKSTTPARLDHNMVYDLRSGWATKDLFNWVTQRTRVQFKMYESPLKILALYVAGLIACVLAMVGLVLLWKNRRGPTDRMFWFVACSFLWGAVFGGTHYCILRDSPAYYINPRTGQTMIFHPQSNAQFLYEGYIMTSTQYLAGMLMMSLAVWYPTVKEGPYKRIGGYVLTASAFAAIYAVRKLYRTKQGWD